VVASISVSGDSDISVSPTSITFTSTNWNIYQTITVSAQEDDDADNGIATIIINAPGFVTAYIPVNEIDNDLPIPATISGKITYTGTKTGSIYIRLFTSPDFSGSPVKSAIISSPGNYYISDITPGTYYVASFMDSNNNGQYDADIDPAGTYSGNPIILQPEETKTGIDITLIDPQEVVKGDINKDGHIDISDVILCLRMVIGLDPVDIETADMNGDGEVDITDVIKILRKSIGLD
ncbi:MAG: dockerin type I domain-containing protein, partial [Candidatus Omnitrophica bacterium]|nr:dockerin type I domain-containing protein [Candidatus Omnitrophota bacterium]